VAHPIAFCAIEWCSDAAGDSASSVRSSQTRFLKRTTYHVPSRLKRYHNARELHFITCSCYRRRPLLGTARQRDLFLKVLEQARQRYQFVVVGCVVMPEHFHLLICEPEKGDPSLDEGGEATVCPDGAQETIIDPDGSVG
jgi:hypothetical protein